jgi:phosphoribosylformylglycinamidine synthase
MLSESQERMLVVVQKGNEHNLKEIFSKWELNCTQIGIVTDTNNLVIYSNNKLIVDIPVESLVLGGGAPQYDMPSTKPAYLSKVNKYKYTEKENSKNNFNKILLTLLGDPNITSKNYIYNQYDSTVRTNTVVGPGSDAAVVRIKDTTKAIAISTDCNGRYVYLDPRVGGMLAVAESARNVVCSGAQPIAITNCLNFGSPQDPEVYWQFKEAVKGVGDMCRVLNTPVTGGNVSFYNETLKSAVYPTPTIGMVGLIEDVNNATTMNLKNEDDLIVILGSLNSQLGGSSYLRTIEGKIQGPLFNFDADEEKQVQDTCLAAIKSKIITSAHDISDGGLAVALSEMVASSKDNLGADIYIESELSDLELLFGECASTIIVTVKKEDLFKLVLITKKYDINSQTIGSVNVDSRLKINDFLNVSKKDICETYFNTLSTLMST